MLCAGVVFGSPVGAEVYSSRHRIPRYGEDFFSSAHTQNLRCSDIRVSVCLQILALVAVRKAMDYLFSQHDLGYLDDVMPEKDKKKKEDEKKKKKKKGSIDSEMNDVSCLSCVSRVLFLAKLWC